MNGLRTRSQSFGQRGFTLVETMTVIGIIVILGGLIFPATSRILAESRSTNCLSNLRQQFSAIESFRQSRNNLLPNCEPIPVVGPDGPFGGLNEALNGYIDPASPVWLCPADDDPESYETGSSYLYLPGLYILTPAVQFQLPSDVFDLSEKERRDMEARLVTVFYEGPSGRTIPLVLDSQDRHPIGSREPRNGLYMDGSARIVEGDVEPEER